MDPTINGGCCSAWDWIAAIAAAASAVAAFFSYRSSKTANALAKYALTKKAQSELFTTILLELADLRRLESADTLVQQDTEFLEKAPRYVELDKRLQRLTVLSPCFKKLVEDSAHQKASEFLANLADESRFALINTDQLEAIISILQQAHRNELNDH